MRPKLKPTTARLSASDLSSRKNFSNRLPGGDDCAFPHSGSAAQGRPFHTQLDGGLCAATLRVFAQVSNVVLWKISSMRACFLVKPSSWELRNKTSSIF